MPQRDDDRYSRQRYVLGAAAQQSVSTADVLLVGTLRGLSAEVSKNLALSGVNSLTLYDPSYVTNADWTANFFLRRRGREEVLGRRDERLATSELQNINPNTKITVHADGQKLKVEEFDVVVALDSYESYLLSLDNECRSKSVPLVCAGTFGLRCYVFNDFGPAFSVVDADGEPPSAGVVTKVSGLVVETEEPHGLSEGDQVRLHGFSRCKDAIVSVARVCDRATFECAAVAGGGFVEGNGYFKQIKKPLDMSFEPFAESFARQTPVLSPFGGRGRRRRDSDENSSSSSDENPSSFDENDDLDWIRSEWKFNKRAKRPRSTPESVVEFFPVTSFCGGIAAQEAIKAVSHKFKPLHQWLVWNAVTAAGFPEPERSISVETYESLNAPSDDSSMMRRSVGLSALLGSDACDKLADSKVFLVGAGALGCEYLKALALSNVKRVVVTDMDVVEISNLSRQFLFRDSHVGKHKSEIAREAVKKINPKMDAIALTLKVCASTENSLSEAGVGWNAHDIVVNALDNVAARLYVDSKCVEHKLPLVEAGTLGAKFNTLPVLPFETESYGSDFASGETPTSSVPTCTLHSFPNRVEHTLQWAREVVFEKEFVSDPAEANLYLQSPEEYEALLFKGNKSSILSRLVATRRIVAKTRLRDESDGTCDVADVSKLSEPVFYALCRFRELFSNKTLHLLAQRPASDAEFWSGKRRPPVPISFDPQDELHVEFVRELASRTLRCYGVDDVVRSDDVRRVFKQRRHEFGEFVPDESKKVASDDKELAELEKDNNCEDVDSMIHRELSELHLSQTSIRMMIPTPFEKDDPDDVAFVCAASEIRARSYGIPSVSRDEAKRIVGRIVPAISTATASCTGIGALELVKILAFSPEKKRYEPACCNVNLAVNAFTFFEPSPVKSFEFGKDVFSIWQPFVELDAQTTTISSALEFFESEYGFEIDSLTLEVDDSAVYSSLVSSHQDRLDRKLADFGFEFSLDGDWCHLDDDDECDPPDLIPKIKLV